MRKVHNKTGRWPLAALVFIVIAALVIFTGCMGESTSDLSIGSKSPDFELYDLEGNIHKLSDYKGTPVLLNFWATWCGPCRSEMPHLEEIYGEWKDKDLTFFAINVGESSVDVISFMDYFGFSMPVLLDSAKTVSRKYGVSGIPTTYFIDEDGIIQSRVAGAFPDRERIEKYVTRLFQQGTD
ncbi:MAG: redoxin domain-containing protein [Dehalococcoidales bacterium]|nr:MAG: redoxin domain-containing protein [Dehalococcoidales bacterium]